MARAISLSLSGNRAFLSGLPRRSSGHAGGLPMREGGSRNGREQEGGSPRPGDRCRGIRHSPACLVPSRSTAEFSASNASGECKHSFDNFLPAWTYCANGLGLRALQWRIGSWALGPGALALHAPTRSCHSAKGPVGARRHGYTRIGGGPAVVARCLRPSRAGPSPTTAVAQRPKCGRNPR
jgi:hypothetical protein